MKKFNKINSADFINITMAFIVPVMKKDYVLYNSTEKKKDRSNSNPIEIRTKNDATRKLFCEQSYDL